MPSQELRAAIRKILQRAHDRRPGILIEAVSAVEGAVRWAIEAIGSMPVVLHDARHRTVLALFASLIELSDCCVKLARSGGFTGVPVLGRTAIEAYVDLKNLVDDAAYLGVLEVAHDKEWSRLLEQAVEHGNPFVASLAGLPDIDERRAELQVRIDQAHAAGVPKRMTKEEKFTKAGMSQEYETVYDVLCAAAHNSPSALMSRHIDVGTWPIQFVVGRQDPAWVDSTMSALAELLRSAGYMVAQFAGSLVPPTTAMDSALARMHGAIAVQPD